MIFFIYKEGIFCYIIIENHIKNNGKETLVNDLICIYKIWISVKGHGSVKILNKYEFSKIMCLRVFQQTNLSTGNAPKHNKYLKVNAFFILEKN